MAGLLVASGCGLWQPPEHPSPASPEEPLIPVNPARYPDFQDDMALDGLALCLQQSLAYLEKVPGNRMYRFGERVVSAKTQVQSLKRFLAFIRQSPSNAEINTFVRTNYTVYRSKGDASSRQVLFTGYYLPLLNGSPVRRSPYLYPLYGRPADMMTIDLEPFDAKYKGQHITGRLNDDTVVPYWTREAIETRHVLDGKAPVLAFVDDPVDLFFLHIQGSGKIHLSTGENLYILYDAQNGRPYRSIGKLLIDRGKIPKEEMSMQRLKAYLRDNPAEVREIFSHNPSYVFFRQGRQGPFGCYGTRLTPGRSIATDRRIFPAAALGYIQTQKPLVDATGRIVQWASCARFVLNQDTGGAIRGPGRVDLYWGEGPYAKIAAGHMQHTGQLYFLIANETATMPS